MTEKGVGQCICAARFAVPLRRFIVVMNHNISNVRNPRERVGKNENGVLGMHRTVDEQYQGTDQAQPPEGNRHDHTLLFFRGNPLHDNSREKYCVAQPAKYLPEMPLNAEKPAAIPDPI